MIEYMLIKIIWLNYFAHEIFYYILSVENVYYIKL